jgi:hypothetical protein
MPLRRNHSPDVSKIFLLLSENNSAGPPQGKDLHAPAVRRVIIA